MRIADKNENESEKPNNLCEKPFYRGMGILPMRRRVIPTLQLVVFPRADYIVKRTARMAVPLLTHTLSMVVGVNTYILSAQIASVAKIAGLARPQIHGNSMFFL